MVMELVLVVVVLEVVVVVVVDDECYVCASAVTSGRVTRSVARH